MSEETSIQKRQSTIVDWLEDAEGVYNYGILSGRMKGEFQYSHKFRNQKFYKAKIEIQRNSGTYDVIPVSIPESALKDLKEKELKGKYVEFTGQICTHDVWEDLGTNGRTHHLVTFFSADRIAESYEENELNNLVYLKGYICKGTFVKTKVSGTKVADIFVAVHRNDGDKDYIPCVSWNFIASWIETQYKVGDKIKLQGRLQSRKYFKKDLCNPDYGEMRTTYEIAIARVL